MMPLQHTALPGVVECRLREHPRRPTAGSVLRCVARRRTECVPLGKQDCLPEVVAASVRIRLRAGMSCSSGERVESPGPALPVLAGTA